LLGGGDERVPGQMVGFTEETAGSLLDGRDGDDSIFGEGGSEAATYRKAVDFPESCLWRDHQGHTPQTDGVVKAVLNGG
jgi:hypothetical protein